MSLIVIVGINGRQGASVAEAFMDVPGYEIRGLTSSLDSPASERWKDMGIEIREETFENEYHVKESFKGATVIFALTSFHKLLRDRRAKLAIEVGSIHVQNVYRATLEREVLMGRMILDAAAATPELQRLVMSTLPVMKPGNKYASHTAGGTYHAKREHIQYLGDCLPALAAKTILVKPCMRMEDYRTTLRMGEDGTLSFGTTAPAHVVLPWINMKEDFGVFVRMVVFKCPCRAPFAAAAYSDHMSGHDICALISKISGIPCKYRQYTVKEMEGLGTTLSSDLLPDSLGSIVFDPKLLTPSAFNDFLSTYNLSFRLSSFEEYLKVVLPEHMASLQGARRCVPEIPRPMATPAKAEEAMLLLMDSARPHRVEDTEGAILRDVFMGYPNQWN